VVTGHEDGCLCARNAATGQERCRLPGHHECVRSVAFSPNGRLLASGSEDMTILISDVSGLAGEDRASRGPTKPRTLSAMWADLADDDAARAFQSLHALAAIPDQSIPFLLKQLRTSWGTKERIAQLVIDLDDRRFSVRRNASIELERIGRPAETALRAALEKRPSLEVYRRIEALLQKLPTSEILTGQQARQLRTVEVLERIGTPPAIEALKCLVHGDPEREFRQQVEASLTRLAKRPK
jgi:hypothetical protein